MCDLSLEHAKRHFSAASTLLFVLSFPWSAPGSEFYSGPFSASLLVHHRALTQPCSRSQCRPFIMFHFLRSHLATSGKL